jgi:two-component system KDP operon response regulator KdpE
MARRAGRAPRLLLVEDSHGDARLLAEGLREGGGEVDLVHTTDAGKAWDVVQRVLSGSAGRPDLMVLDLGLPGSSGLELLARMRKEAKGADWPVVILTSSLGDEDIRQARAHQAAGYFAKPLTVEGYVQLGQVLRERWLEPGR